MSTPGTPSPVSADEDIWNTSYAEKEHLEAFERALAISDVIPPEGDASPSSPRSPPMSIDARLSSTHTWKYGENGSSLGAELGHHGRGGGERVEKLTATSDFAPIHQRVSRRRPSAAQQGLTYHLLRWPILGFIFLIIYFEFGAYVLIRQIVNAFEYLVAWRGHKSALRQEMRKAKTYDEWVAAAKKLDAYLGFDEWKEIEEDSYFDHSLVKRVRRTLTKLRNAKDTRGLMDALAVCIRSNFAGTEGVKMYSETFYGTKRVVENHVSEVAACLDFIRTATDVSLEEKRAFFRAVNKNYGSSALCLSGGASFGYYHFGVVKAFLDADLLPRVVTGTSAGGLVAALLCTRTNEELKQLLVPRLADKITACSDPFRVWFKRFRKTGARFSSVEWAEKAMFFTRGSLTFKEAYERTGRALNVSVVPSDRHSPTILLNHLNAPNCLIWSAILASAAVPGILNPVVLMAKDRNGQVKPHNLGGSRFKDGSLREDIPLGSLHTQFNCNFSIVSQTNPHIHLFFFAPRGSVGRPVAHRKGKGWRGGFVLSALESYIKLDLTKHFKVIRDLDLLPQLLQSDWSGVFLQRFSGDLTLTPRSTLGDWLRILSDPNQQQLERMLDVGQKVSWPALRMVHNRMMIERAILRGRTEVRQALHRDKTTIDRDTDRPVDNLHPLLQVPIESDADAGFALRSRKAKSARPRITTSEPFPGQNGVRNRSSLSRRAQIAASSQHQDKEDKQTEKGYASTLSDRLRHVRSSSLGTFANPFRRSSQTSVHGTTGTGGDSTPEEIPRRRSQMSITKWFGGVSESSSDEEDDEDGSGSGGGHGVDGDETPMFGAGGGGGMMDETALIDDDSSDDEEDRNGLVEPLPVGKSGDHRTIGASTASGEDLREPLETDQSRASMEYSPPQQDRL